MGADLYINLGLFFDIIFDIIYQSAMDDMKKKVEAARICTQVLKDCKFSMTRLGRLQILSELLWTVRELRPALSTRKKHRPLRDYFLLLTRPPDNTSVNTPLKYTNNSLSQFVIHR